MEKDLSAEIIAVIHRFKKISMDSMFPEISKGEFWVLKMIHVTSMKNEEGKGVYVSSIAKHLKVTPSAISRMLKGLEQKELIERSVDRNDRRNTCVFLTEKGDILRKKVETEMSAFSKDVIESMGEEDAQMLLKLFNKMVDIMEEEIKKYQNK